MAGGDRTGPRGDGPKTGRGMGFCEGFDAPGTMSTRGAGRGFGDARGRGMGRGRRWRGRASAATDFSPERTQARPLVDGEAAALHARLDELSGMMRDLHERLDHRDGQ